MRQISQKVNAQNALDTICDLMYNFSITKSAADIRFGEGWDMKIGNFVVALALTFVWIILVESFSVIAISTGFIISIVCVFFAKKYLPLPAITGVDFKKLATYPFFLLGQIFSASIYVSQIILFGAKTDILDVKTKIENEQLRVMLADSVTLTPGSLLLELNEEKMTILWLRKKGAPEVATVSNAAELIMGKLENQLEKAQR